jgi:hypothetical protein
MRVAEKLDWKRLKGNNRAHVASLGPEINSLSCLCVLQCIRSESHCVFRLRYVHLAVSTEVAVAVCCCLIVFSC